MQLHYDKSQWCKWKARKKWENRNEKFRLLARNCGLNFYIFYDCFISHFIFLLYILLYAISHHHHHDEDLHSFKIIFYWYTLECELRRFLRRVIYYLDNLDSCKNRNNIKSVFIMYHEHLNRKWASDIPCELFNHSWALIWFPLRMSRNLNWNFKNSEFLSWNV